MTAHVPAFFNGLSPEQLAQALGRLERRRFPPGATVLAEGESARELYLTPGAFEIFRKTKAQTSIILKNEYECIWTVRDLSPHMNVRSGDRDLLPTHTNRVV